MTPAQSAWLRKLRDDKAQFRPTRLRHFICQMRGWVKVAPCETAVLSRRWAFVYMITPAGLAALAEYEEKVK
jgi:hypothetical protein